MKKLLLVVMGVILFAGASYAQQYKPFKVGLGLGYASPAGEGTGGGALLYLEPMYRISDEIAVGFRIETALVAKAAVTPEGELGDLKVSGLGSYTVSGQYYLSNNSFRPFVGAGMGLYRIASMAMDQNTVGVSNEAKFGFYPRVGFDAGHFNMQLEYNIIGSSDAGTFNGEELRIKNSYLAFKIGASISGGKKKK